MQLVSQIDDRFPPEERNVLDGRTLGSDTKSGSLKKYFEGFDL